MSKTRRAIVEYAKAQVYWYTHQFNVVAKLKADMLEKQAHRLINQSGTPEDSAALMQAHWRTTYLIPHN